MGLRSINNIVDITNFVLIEIGQPMHAFDLADLQGNEIIIRRANSGEKIVTLDEKEFALSDSNLVICDAVKPVAIAGVMGGLNSEIKSTTKNIIFESAKFARDNIRKTSRTLGQRTDASSRYEKGVDAYTAEIGMKRALNLIEKLGCGRIACDNYDLCSEKLEEKVITTTISKVNGVLGIDIPANEINDILTRLGFNSKMVITGDITQIDLRNNVKSGLKQVQEILNGIKEIKFIVMDSTDVCRHPLVQKIIDAYEIYEN
jgi:phenylalanyl-tRNA synthetase beta chain